MVKYNNNRGMFFVLFSLSALAMTPSLPTDGYVPTLLYIGNYFQLSESEMQLTLSIFVLTTGLGQLLFGPLSDHAGRRLTAFLVMILFAIGSYFYMHAGSYKEFLFYRFIQGLGAAGMLVIAPAIVRDVYSGVKISKIYGYLGAVCALSPIAAPLLGGYLASHFGWQSAGYMYLVPVLLSMIIIYSLVPETLPARKRVKLNLKLLDAYKNILLNRPFLIYTFISSVGLSMAFLFTSTSAYILMDLLKISPYAYDICYSFYGVIFLLGNFTSGYIVEKVGIDKVIFYGLLMGTTGACLMLIWNYYELSYYSFYIPMMVAVVGGTFCLIAGAGGAIKGFSINAGAAIALMNAIRLVVISLVGILVVNKDIQSAFPIGISILLLNFFGAALFLGRVFLFKLLSL